MGVYASFITYKKDSSYIISEDSVLGIFTVDYEKKDEFELHEQSVSFYGGIRSIDKLRHVNLTDSDIYEDFFGLFRFYLLAVGPYGEKVERVKERLQSLLFDPRTMLPGIDFLLGYMPNFGEEDLKQIQKYEEEESLRKLRQMVTKAIELDGLVSCSMA